MNDYAVMHYPAANRVYAESSIRLLVSELRAFDERALGNRLGDIAETAIGGVGYVTFSAPELSELDVELLSNVSTLYALFEVQGDVLRPITVRRLDKFDSDLLTIQKYAGKTNELFTKLLLNVTALAIEEPSRMVTDRLRVLDPMCGRGTTHNHAMMYGYDVSGLDLDPKDFDEYTRFIKTWLKNKRIKHQADAAPIRRNHVHLGRRLDITLGIDKESYKAGDALQVNYVNADTLRSNEFFRARWFDLIVTDAPYGIQHGSRSGAGVPSRQQRTGDLSRDPRRLLGQAIPVWAGMLRPGGAIGISWNDLVLDRAELTDMVTDAGLDVLESEAYLGFAHRVDQAINRDVLVARKPA
ncbi:MAG TPA: SAM-dependent methyltransferase [Pseudonocardiaceae bacterium]|nr:SAM-dependent methyltransferase [Pseudonocardiaceae bacterium]